MVRFLAISNKRENKNREREVFEANLEEESKRTLAIAPTKQSVTRTAMEAQSHDDLRETAINAMFLSLSL